MKITKPEFSFFVKLISKRKISYIINLFMVFLQKVSFCKFTSKSRGLFSAYRRKKIVFGVVSFILTPPLVLADAYGPLSKDRDLGVVKEKKWSIEAGGMVGSFNGTVSTTTGLLPYLTLSSSSIENKLLLLSLFPISQKISGSTNAGTFLVSYKLFKRFSIDFGVISLQSDNGPRIGFKYFLTDGVFKPFVSLHTSNPIEVLTYGVGGRYEISESFYLDTSITRTSFESRFADNRFEATSIGLELRAGYLF